MPNIFADFAKPVRSVEDYLADNDNRAIRREQLVGVQRTNEIAALSANQTRQAMADSERSNSIIRAAYGANPGATDDDIIAGLRKTGDRGALEYSTKLDEQRGKREETAAKTRESQVKAMNQVADAVKRFSTGVMANPSQQTAMAAIDNTEALHRHFGIPGDFASERQQVMKMTSADQILKWAAGNLSDSALLIKKLQSVNAGNAHVQQAVDPLTGAVTEIGRTAITQSPDNAATQATALAGQRSVAATAAAGREQSASQFKARQDSSPAVDGGADPVQTALNKKFGKPEVGRRWKADGSLEPIPGGSADRKTNEQQAGKETVDAVVASLRQSYDALNTGGGITSTEKGAVGNLSAAMSRSSAGQTVGGAFGTRNQKERDAVAQARPLLLQAIMKATGMSAKQMDSNAELKLYLATATDPQLTLEANREALDRIEKLYGSGSTGAAPAKPGKAVKRTGTSNGRKVIEYTDGSIEYAD